MHLNLPRAAIFAVSATLIGCAEVSQTASYLTEQLGMPSTRVTEDTTACADPRAAYLREANAAKTLDTMVSVGKSALDIAGFRLGGGGASQFEAALSGQFNQVVNDLTASARESAQRTRTFNAAFDTLYDCRTAEAARINRDRRAGRLSMADAEAQMALLRTLVEEDIRIARGVQIEIAGRQQSFEVAQQKARAQTTAPTSRQEQVERSDQVAELDEEIATNERVYQASVAQVDTAEQQVAQQSSGPFKVAALDRATHRA